MGLDIPNWVKTMIVKQVLKNAPDLANVWQDGNIPELDAMMATLRDGGTLKEGLESYFKLTESVKDDEILTKVDEVFEKILTYANAVMEALDGKPFMDVVNEYASDLHIPDFDGDEANDKTLAAFLAELVTALAD